MNRETTVDAETERTRRMWEKMAGNYDRGMDLVERLLFAGPFAELGEATQVVALSPCRRPASKISPCHHV